MNQNQIKHMTEKFLSWRLPNDFNPDGGIKFTKVSNPNTAYQYTYEPIGTNLFNCEQAKAMVEYISQGLTLENQLTSEEILVEQLKEQIITLYGISFLLSDKSYKKDLKALMRALSYNLVKDDYDNWVSENIVSKR